jgi:excisionase family DNA binding protein
LIKTSNNLGKIKDLQDWISQAEAARLRGVSPQGISDLIARGRLQTLRVGGKTLVSRSEVMAFEPKPGGRPLKKAAAKKQPVPKKKNE